MRCGQRFESARRLFFFSLDKPNSRGGRGFWQQIQEAFDTTLISMGKLAGQLPPENLHLTGARHGASQAGWYRGHLERTSRSRWIAVAHPPPNLLHRQVGLDQ